MPSLISIVVPVSVCQFGTNPDIPGKGKSPSKNVFPQGPAGKSVLALSWLLIGGNAIPGQMCNLNSHTWNSSGTCYRSNQRSKISWEFWFNVVLNTQALCRIYHPPSQHCLPWLERRHRRGRGRMKISWQVMEKSPSHWESYPYPGAFNACILLPWCLQQVDNSTTQRDSL